MTTDSDDAILRLLRRHFQGRWRIRRTTRLWIATAEDYLTGHAPTIVETDLNTFVRQLEDPPPSAGRSLLSRPAFRDHLDQVGEDGVYHQPNPPTA
ncbi:hypothetical protein [Marinitenerispora sediminis]|uniref:Uncharacterized protein n=1 Tax=Marinitenerispora sediminis TaxID=1931232 RepID=A0A368T4U7_9ACTN|nr:hypothetical protein [Marinitenerispora sediminis]RCV49830.1 hypothetical protein DEF28_19665 [Marinitenerispora sediminis]RCV53924.1 hypothetical protein DEF23_16850 [Marinitenerispora sediminis]RCV58396.1 hypothetical protein DEF24_13590 [Marinitenerispora sediminis]